VSAFFGNHHEQVPAEMAGHHDVGFGVIDLDRQHRGQCRIELLWAAATRSSGQRRAGTSWRRIPIRLQRRGGRKLIMTPGGDAAAGIEAAIAASLSVGR